ncbi:MAG: toll/interleukin-1 receptor domain-containing protein [Bacteroidetes bacterium]|nr:toll/interleukin-1 receptor domain-containing protein [Bacteroidota bacterium]
MKVFISHSSTDKKFVRTLKEDLNENGIETWFDEDELDLGDSLADKLELALEESSHFIIVLSPASASSEWVKSLNWRKQLNREY